MPKMEPLIRDFRLVYDKAEHSLVCAWLRDWAVNAQAKIPEWNTFIECLENHVDKNSAFWATILTCFQVETPNLPVSWATWFGQKRIGSQFFDCETGNLQDLLNCYNTSWGHKLLMHAGDTTARVTFVSRKTKEKGVCITIKPSYVDFVTNETDSDDENDDDNNENDDYDNDDDEVLGVKWNSRAKLSKKSILYISEKEGFLQLRDPNRGAVVNFAAMNSLTVTDDMIFQKIDGISKQSFLTKRTLAIQELGEKEKSTPKDSNPTYFGKSIIIDAIGTIQREVCKKIIDAFGPDFRDAQFEKKKFTEERAYELLTEAYTTALNLAEKEADITNISFSLLSVEFPGFSGFKKDNIPKLIECGIKAIQDYFKHTPGTKLEKVFLCANKKQNINLLRAAAQKCFKDTISSVPNLTSIVIEVPRNGADVERERTETYVEQATTVRGIIIDKMQKYAKFKTNATRTICVNFGNDNQPISWWHIDFVFIAFSAAVGYKSDTIINTEIVLAGIPGIQIKCEDNSARAQLMANTNAFRVLQENIFLWGKWDLTTNVANTQSSNAQFFDNCFTNPDCANDFELYAKTWLDANKNTDKTELTIDYMRFALARCALLRVDANTLFRIIQTWRLFYQKDDSEGVELPKIIKGPTIEYGKIETGDGYVLQEFAPIEHMDDFKRIFDDCDNDEEVQKCWDVFSIEGCAIIKKNIFVPKPHATTVSAMTFYYIFKAFKLSEVSKTAEHTVTVEYAPKGNNDIYFLEEMCHMGFTLAKMSGLNIAIKCIAPTEQRREDLNRNIPHLSIRPAETFSLFFKFLGDLEETIITIAEDETNLKLVNDIKWTSTEVMQQSKPDNSKFVTLDNDLRTGLTPEDFESMKPKKYLTDNVITKYAKHLQLVAGENQNEEFLSRLKSIYIFETTAGKDFTDGVVRQSFTRPRFREKLQAYSIFVVPTNLLTGPEENQKKHWFCFYVLQEKNVWTFYLCDSLSYLEPSQLKAELQKSLTTIGVIKRTDAIADEVNEKVLPQQTDGYNCGVYVLHYIYLMLNEKNFGATDYESGIDINVKRNDIFAWAKFGAFPELPNNEFSLRMSILLQIFRYLPNDPHARSKIFELTENGVKVYVKQSTISGAGYGLFTVNQIEKDTPLLKDEDQWGPRLHVPGGETEFELNNDDGLDDDVFVKQWDTQTNKFVLEHWVKFVSRWNAYVKKIAEQQFQGEFKEQFEIKHLLQTNVEADPYALEFPTDNRDDTGKKIISRRAFWLNPFNTLIGFTNSHKKTTLPNLQLIGAQLVADRDIRPNEELFFDYGPKYVFS